MQIHNAGGARTYSLAKDVYVCASSGHVVFLDLKSGRYMTLQQRAARSLSHHVVGWPIPEAVVEQNPSSLSDVENLLRQLVQRGLLTTETTASDGNARPPTLASPTTTLLDSIHLRKPVIRPHHLASFLLCSYRARA